MDSIVFALLCAVGIVIVIVWIQVATMRLNRKLKKEGKDPVPERAVPCPHQNFFVRLVWQVCSCYDFSRVNPVLEVHLHERQSE